MPLFGSLGGSKSPGKTYHQSMGKSEAAASLWASPFLATSWNKTNYSRVFWFNMSCRVTFFCSAFTSFSHLSPASCGKQGPCTDLSPQHNAFMLVEVLILLRYAVHAELPASQAPCGRITWVSWGVWLLWIRCCGVTFSVTSLNSDPTLRGRYHSLLRFYYEERSIYRGSKVTCQ